MRIEGAGRSVSRTERGFPNRLRPPPHRMAASRGAVHRTAEHHSAIGRDPPNGRAHRTVGWVHPLIRPSALRRDQLGTVGRETPAGDGPGEARPARSGYAPRFERDGNGLLCRANREKAGHPTGAEFEHIATTVNDDVKKGRLVGEATAPDASSEAHSPRQPAHDNVGLVFEDVKNGAPAEPLRAIPTASSMSGSMTV